MLVSYSLISNSEMIGFRWILSKNDQDKQAMF